jgi:hypothetical protein
MIALIKNKVGRPQKKIEDILGDGWQKTVIDMMAEGASAVEVRAQLCYDYNLKVFNHDLWDVLIEREEEFSSTINKGMGLCQAWWEKVSRDNVYHDKDSVFETGAWYANMKNRFGWHDKKEINVNFSLAEKLSGSRSRLNRLEEVLSN